MAAVHSPHAIPSAVDRPVQEPSFDRTDDISDAAWIRHLLAANDGCLWQSEVVSLMQISKATVSRRLADLEDAGDVERLEYRGRKIVWLR